MKPLSTSQMESRLRAELERSTDGDGFVSNSSYGLAIAIGERTGEEPLEVCDRVRPRTDGSGEEASESAGHEVSPAVLPWSPQLAFAHMRLPVTFDYDPKGGPRSRVIVSLLDQPSVSAKGADETNALLNLLTEVGQFARACAARQT